VKPIYQMLRGFHVALCRQTMAPHLAPKPGGRDRGEATMSVRPEVRTSGRSADLQQREILPNAWGTDR
jgi:hypothetical protein